MSNKKAFSIAEVVVSLSLLLMVMASILSFVTYHLKLKSKIENYFMLNELAKESIETITFLRDKNYIDNHSYTLGITSGTTRKVITSFNKTLNRWELITLDPLSTIDTCTLNETCPIYDDSGFFIQKASAGGLTKTNFYRLITITVIDSNHFKIISETAYKEKNITKSKIKLIKELWNIR